MIKQIRTMKNKAEHSRPSRTELVTLSVERNNILASFILTSPAFRRDRVTPNEGEPINTKTAPDNNLNLAGSYDVLWDLYESTNVVNGTHFKATSRMAEEKQPVAFCPGGIGLQFSNPETGKTICILRSTDWLALGTGETPICGYNALDSAPPWPQLAGRQSCWTWAESEYSKPGLALTCLLQDGTVSANVVPAWPRSRGRRR
jgi:hypothetical protein